MWTLKAIQKLTFRNRFTLRNFYRMVVGFAPIDLDDFPVLERFI